MLEPIKTTTKMAAELEDGKHTHTKNPQKFKSISLEKTVSKQTLQSQERAFVLIPQKKEKKKKKDFYDCEAFYSVFNLV